MIVFDEKVIKIAYILQTVKNRSNIVWPISRKVYADFVTSRAWNAIIIWCFAELEQSAAKCQVLAILGVFKLSQRLPLLNRIKIV